MAELFWLSDEQWKAMAPFMPTNQPGARRKDDRTILSSVLHVIKCGCRWKDCPSEYGPSTTVHHRPPPSTTASTGGRAASSGPACWSPWPRPDGQARLPPSTRPPSKPSAPPTAEKGGREQAIGPSRAGPTTQIHVLTDVIGRPGVIHLTPGNASDVNTAPAVLDKAPSRVRRLIADKGYDADWLRHDLREQGISVVVPGTRARKRKIRLDKRLYRDRWRVEAVFCRLKDFRRIATRSDKLARNVASALALAAVIAFWC